MKHLFITFLGIVVLSTVGTFSTFAQASKAKTEVSQSSKVEVFYFHFTRRCNTCKAVEKNAQDALMALYPTECKAGKYSFKAANIDEKDGKALAEKMGIGGQTLLVVANGKRVDLTDKGFMYSDKPEKIKDEIKKAVEQVVKK